MKIADIRGAGYLLALLALLSVPLPVPPAEAGSFHREFRDLLAKTPPGTDVTGLVMLHEQLDTPTLEREISRLGLDSRWRRHEYVIRTAQTLAARTQGDLLRQLEDFRSRGLVRSYESFWITNMVAVDAVPEVFRALEGRSDVGTIFVDKPLELRQGWDDPRQGGRGGERSLSDNLVCVDVQPAWDRGFHGEGRLVGLFDTGADGNHEAFASRWRGAQPGIPWWYAWKDPYTQSTFPWDSGTHGTHVLGIMTGVMPDGTPLGVAPGAQWMAAGVIIGFNVSKIISCYQWAADPDGDPSTIDDVPDVVNNSWGTSDDCDETFWNAIDVIEAAGVVNTIAVDNTGPNPMTVNSPESRAATPTVNWGVGNVDPHQPGYPINIYSGRGPSPCDSVSIKPEVTAPGTQIYSSLPGNAYGYKTGTSMACPHTSGAVAILRQVNPDLTVDEVKTILMSTALDRGDPGEDNTYGWGIIDIGAAVDYALATLPRNPPRSLTAVVDVDSVGLSWERPAKIYQNNPFLRYRLYRAPVGQGFPANPIAELGDTSAVVSYHDDAVPWGDYQYAVTALYQNGESDPSNIADANVILSPPTNLTIHVEADTVHLAWQRPAPIFPGIPLQSYSVWRAAIGEPFPANPIASFPDTSATPGYTDPAVPLGEYHYAVSAVYTAGESGLSNDVQAVIALDPPRGLTSTVDADTVRLAWQGPEHVFQGETLEAFRIYRAAVGDSFPSNPIGSVPASLGVLAYADTSGLAPGRYRYTTTALYSGGESRRSNVVEADLFVPPPRNLTANVVGHTVYLGWLRPSGVSGSNPLRTYRVFRAPLDQPFPQSPLAEFADTSATVSYIDPLVVTGRYHYVVVATYQVSASPPSNEADAYVNAPADANALGTAAAPLRAAPNPFNPITVIHYRPLNGAPLRITICDARGAVVRDLLAASSPSQTDQSIAWDGRDNAGHPTASGMYFVRMSQGGRVQVCRVTLLK